MAEVKRLRTWYTEHIKAELSAEEEADADERPESRDCRKSHCDGESMADKQQESHRGRVKSQSREYHSIDSYPRNSTNTVTSPVMT